jgi:hypothetical protein
LRGCVLAWINAGRIFLVELTLGHGFVKSPKALLWLYLVKVHIWFMSLLTMAVLLILQGLFGFWLPFMYNNWPLTEFSWPLRFQISSVQLMLIPLLFNNVVQLFCLSKQNMQDGLDWEFLNAAQSITLGAEPQRPRSPEASPVDVLDRFYNVGADGKDPFQRVLGGQAADSIGVLL